MREANAAGDVIRRAVDAIDQSINVRTMMHAHEELERRTCAWREDDFGNQQIEKARAAVIAGVFLLPVGNAGDITGAEQAETEVFVEIIVAGKIFPARHRGEGELHLMALTETLGDPAFEFEIDRHVGKAPPSVNGVRVDDVSDCSRLRHGRSMTIAASA
jgi:hypothetical protein